ncbi:Ulp1 protease family, C-terminal catalytic domain containing protein [Parasponia andersonii]|uniref:Ulp1 protease family, C-terminal catalytic domain containing protein n=1 Tax=Parasponia andersonii TaxID=3476 RepID=A0A2P5D4D5_PARAD|nr:Ulp1 protease family, C-terminal catalytic domain containing protein [Parasponia andersonii]
MASQSGNSQDDRACYLADELKRAHAGQLYFLPYNFGAHWVLVIINPCSNCVYFFDSMQQPICDGLKNVVESGLQMCGLKQKLPIWEKVKCPHQLTSTECGFYVMRYMKEIIDEQMHAINLEFNGKNSYTKEEIDEVRAEWGIIMQAYI